MGKKRVGDPDYYKGVNAVGRSSWMLKPGAVSGNETLNRPGSVQGLIEQDSTAAADLVALPRPNRNLALLLERESDWSGMDLSGLDLRGIDNYGGRLSETNFAGSDLRAANFECCFGEGMNLTGARVSGLNLASAAFSEVEAGGEFDFSGVRLLGSSVRFGTYTRVTGLKDAVLLHGVNTSHLKLGGAVFEDVDLTNKDLEAVDIFMNSRFTSVSFGTAEEPVTLSYTSFRSCDFDDAVFPGVHLSSVLFTQCRFNDSAFSDAAATLENRFNSCELSNVYLTGWKYVGSSMGPPSRVSFTNVSSDAVNLAGSESKIVKEFIHGGGGYESFTLPQVAEALGVSTQEVGLLVWLGELEARDNSSFEVVTSGDVENFHIPWWALKGTSVQ